MATLVLQAAGSAIGSAIGGPIMAAVGQAAGATLGSMIDRSLMGGGKRAVEGPRLKQLDGISASEGTPIPRVYGRVRLGGQVIWATKFEEQAQTQRQGKSGGKSTGASAPQTTTTTYSYFANVAVALCEGPIAMVRRVWADGKVLDLTTVTHRVYPGNETQTADPLIVAKQGESPAYRGTAYVVFERLPLEAFGNRLPQLSFEVVRPVGGANAYIRGVDLIPGASEFAYQPTPVSRVLGQGVSAPENRNQLTHTSDLAASLDALEACLPNARSVALVSSWFGTDLRAGACQIAPAVDSRIKQTHGAAWSVAGQSRETARLVTEIDGRAAYGGTPSDAAIIAAIGEMKARDLSVVFYPFVMMDIAPDNTLPDPWTGTAGQPAFPWRGRITASIAPDRPGSPDGTVAVAGEVASFFGGVTAAHFTVSGADISYSGPDEWTYSRMVLHAAALCKAADGVDAFLIGSELISLTRLRSAPGVYPAVQHLKTLAAEVRTLLGPAVKIGYAADWTEYGAHVRQGGDEVRFPLDPLWADPNIDFVGIDYYPPVADWRDGADHDDAQVWPDGRDVDYLKAGFGAGEAFDWYYADGAARAEQARSPITDGAFGKPWTFRAKDIAGWWSNAHVARVGGVETAATDWVPHSKPVWLTEVGCPAVDKGANAPNLFPDAKSSESALPPFSNGGRDDLLQARFLEAVAARFDPAHPAFEPAHNPVSTVYGARMVDPSRIHVWAWDARPYPAFPHLSDVWGDGENWLTGHWLNGRIEGMALDRLIAAIVDDFGLEPAEYRGVDGFLDGYVIDRPMSVRAALEPLLALFSVDASAVAGTVRFAGRARPARVGLTRDDLVPDSKDREISRTRGQETELPRQITLGFADAESQYQRAAVTAIRPLTTSRRAEASETTAVLRRSQAHDLVEVVLQDSWVGRETASFTLRPSQLHLEPGDVVSFAAEGQDLHYQITKIADGLARQCEARAIETDTTVLAGDRTPVERWSAPAVPGPAHVQLVDLPLDPGAPTPLAALAVSASPWSGPYTVWRAQQGAGFVPVATVTRGAILGTTTSGLPAGPLWRWDRRATLTLRLEGGALSAQGDLGALAGRMLLGVAGADGSWEILSFAQAEFIGPGEWRISKLLRGLAGSEAAASRALPAGAPVVVIDEALTALFTAPDDVGATAEFRLSPAGRDHADPAAVAFSATARPSALLPLAPVHAVARRTAEGVIIRFVRRTRRGGDNWDLEDVPLGEDVEAYRITFLDGETAVRTLTAATPSVLYAASDEIADFGSPRTILNLTIAQISRSVGPGSPLSVALKIRQPV